MNKATKVIIGVVILTVVAWGGVKLLGTKNEKAIEPIKIGGDFAIDRQCC